MKDADEVFGEVKLKGDDYSYQGESSFLDDYNEIKEQRDTEVLDMQTDIGAKKQAELDLERARHNQKVENIEEAMERTRSGDLTPPLNVDSDTWLRELSRSLGCEENIFADTMAEIRGRYGREARKLEDEILKKFGREEMKLLIDETVGLVGDGYDIQDIYGKLKESLESWAGGGAESE